MPDYEFLAARIMKEFGWTIEYVLGLSFPVFFELFGMIRRIRLDSAIDQFYLPYAAAKYGGKCQTNLFEGRGGFFIDTKTGKQTGKGYSRRALKIAEQRMARIIEQQNEALLKAAAEAPPVDVS